MAKKKRPVKQNRKKPHLQMALICERVITEDNKLLTLVRVLDQLTVTSDKDELPPGTLMVSIVVAFKSGDALGTRKVKIIGRNPRGEKVCRMSAELKLLGGAGGSIIKSEVPLPIQMVGLYWFDVFLGTELVTRMPLQVLYAKKQPQVPPVKLAKKTSGKQRTRRKKS